MPHWQKRRKPFSARLFDLFVTLVIIGMAVIALFGMANEIALISGYRIDWSLR